MKRTALWWPLLQLHPAFPYLCGGEARRATVLQHHHNILLCHNITARWKVGGVSVFPEGILRVQRVWKGGGAQKEKRGCSVSDSAACGLSVEGDQLCLCAARHSLRGLLRLLLLLRATRGSHLLVHGLLAWYVGLLWGHVGVLSRQC